MLAQDGSRYYTLRRRILVVDWLGRFGQVKDDGAVRLGSAAICVGAGEVDSAVKVQGTVRQDVNVQRLEVGRGVDQADVARLDEVVGDDDVLLVRSDLDVVRTDRRLHLVWIVEALGVVEVGDVESCNVVGRRQRQVDELSVLREVAVDCHRVACFGPEIVEELSDTLRAVGVGAIRIDDPDLPEVSRSGKGC